MSWMFPNLFSCRVFNGHLGDFQFFANLNSKVHVFLYVPITCVGEILEVVGQGLCMSCHLAPRVTPCSFLD